MFLARRKKDLLSDVPLDTLQDLTRILLIDDEDRSDVITYLSREKWHCRQLRDVDSLENAEIKDSHIICIDIRGVGRQLNKENEGLDLVVSIHTRYPQKKIVLYSSKPIHNIFHEANNLIDKRIYKRSGDLEVFRSAIQELSVKCFVWPEVIAYAYSITKTYLPHSMDQDEFGKILTSAVLAKRRWSVDRLTRALAVGANAAQVIQLLLQLFLSKSK